MGLSSPIKVLVGIPSDDIEESKMLLSWAINVLAHQHDCIVATHVLVSDDTKRRASTAMTMKIQSQLRRAKAYVISILGEFANISQSKQVNLEARVGFNSSIGRGLIEEAKSISADLLVLRGVRNKSNRTPSSIARYCFENAPEKCTLIFLGKQEQLKQYFDSHSDSLPSKDVKMGTGEDKCEGEVLRAQKAESNRVPPLMAADDEVEASGDSVSNTTTEDDSSTSGDCSTIGSPPPLVSPFKSQSGDSQRHRQRMSPCKLISSFIGSPFRKRNCSFSEKQSHDQPLLRCFSYEEILNATNNFHPEMVGQGGYSEVYKGELSDGKMIAVKRLTKDNKDGNKEKEFLMELGIIGHVFHPNTASLLGCCIENGLYLIFNFSQNGNLSSALHGKSSKILEWSVRYKIALGIAKGLHYLHECCKHRIIHRDIKASNVLLGPDYEPQITDFGLAKWLPNKWTHHAVVPIEGTFGYLAPEYFMHGFVDEKTDVFAFGVLLLEIVTGRKPVDSSKQSLLLWAKPLMESGEIGKLADPRLKCYDAKELQRVVLAASCCVRQSSVERPTMSEVLDVLNKGYDSEIAKSLRTPKLRSNDDNELDDYSMIFGYEVPIDILLEDYL
ncbi:probable receptor-like serine/threonine-protein kinase At5g57670 isoform X2 [Cucumis sativus]|uniref:probable receptor-like serine/threonine-protein kinase At5g57670 isoform X2 n=1 Tax=Cucumis sativus TaxID=3659 RepID=UPI0012F48EA8|nr:probable receptor-like serine/threonine-protein kinase At5g57670 isoform X2 [Cucumis sativus]